MKNRLQLLGLPSFDHLIFSVCLLIFLHGTWISIYQIHLSGVNITQVSKSRKATLESLICLICHWKLSRKLLILVQISDYGEPGCQSDHNSRCVKFAYFGYVLTPFWRRQLLKRTSGGALWSGADGPRLRAGWSATWREAAVLSGQARTVRGTGPDGPRPGAGARVPCLTVGRSTRAQGRRKIAGGAWISLPGGTPSGRRDPRSCLGSGRPT
jgi:hypothetical protein